MSRYPVDEIASIFLDSLHMSPAVVVQAPPGAGKTTRLPLLLLDDPRFSTSRVIMLEPRRLAAIHAARWMAAARSEAPGDTIGYATRYERIAGRRTRLEIVTEGILARRLQSDPLLEGVDIVIFDEFHERNLNSDLSLTLCRDVQKALRPDLKIVVMSATLDAEPVASFLGNAPMITSAGKSFPVEVRYEERDPQGKLPEIMAAAIRKALRETEGDVLAFLPGAGEIRRCTGLLADLDGQVQVSPLFADLPFDQQERAIRPANRRKVVLATTIAETSLTIDGVRVVVDSGWTRVSRFDPATGLDRLVTVRVSQAAATQRTGRGGRTAPGVCYRLWSRHTDGMLPPFTPPEIVTSDLSSLVLDLAQWGVRDPQGLDWLEPPDAVRFQHGRTLLQELGALDQNGFITAVGKKMAEIALHPRLSRLVVEARSVGLTGVACDIAALLSERDMFRDLPDSARHVTSSDVIDRLDALRAWRQKRPLAGPDPGACRTIERLADLLRRRLKAPDDVVPEADAIGRLLSFAYPDRVAKRRENGGDRYVFVSGRGGKLSRRSQVGNAEYLIATVVEPKEGGDSIIHMASAVSEDVVRERFADRIETRRVVEWDSRGGRASAREVVALGAVVLSERTAVPTSGEIGAAVIQGIVAGGGVRLLKWTPAARQLQARMAFLGGTFPEENFPDLSDDALTASLGEWLPAWSANAKSLQDLARIDMMAVLTSFLTRDQLGRVEKDAPAALMVPTGSRITIDYMSGKPVLSVKLQELFGLAQTPTVARGKVPVLLHLLSPAGRPIQVTTDLSNFWNRGYQEVKKELKGRYPKHPWPDDPWTAVPMRGVKKR